MLSVLKRSPVMLPIPGMSSIVRLEENAAARNITISSDDYLALDRAGRGVSETSTTQDVKIVTMSRLAKEA
ncbi:MAG: hypothetical protein WDN50_08145 [Bradyrhizobium sp.]